MCAAKGAQKISHIIFIWEIRHVGTHTAQQ